MVELAVDRIGDLRGVASYVMGYGRELEKGSVLGETIFGREV